MTKEEMERTMQFIIEQQAKNAVGIDELKEAQARTTTSIEAISRNLGELTGIVASLTDSVRTMEVQVEIDRKEFRENQESMRIETREAFDKLILSNEVTRDLANKIGELAVNTSRRVSRLESEISPETSS
jgi:hypothetical protein